MEPVGEASTDAESGMIMRNPSISRHARRSLGAGLAAAALLLAGCNRGPSPEVQQKLQQLETVSAEKDSLLQQVADNAKLMSDISATLATVKYHPPASLASPAESPSSAARDSLLWRIKDVTSRVNEAESRLSASRSRVRHLTHLSDSLKATLDTTIAQLQGTIDQQKATIADLTEQVTTLQTQNQQLTARNVALTDTLNTVTTRENTAYYIVGTKDSLLKAGIIVKEGGARFLFIFGKRGETLAPARDLNPDAFTRINLRTDTTIALPDTTAHYKIVSRQDLNYLAAPPDDHGRVQGEVAIANPSDFWAASKYLILVKE